MKFHRNGSLPRNGEIFVFGSNLLGIHGAGAALVAKRCYGALDKRGRGPQGQSYALPTKYSPRITIPMDVITRHVQAFLNYARQHPELEFFVTAVGTGLAMYRHEDIAPMFRDAPDNCSFPWEWITYVSPEGAVEVTEHDG